MLTLLRHLILLTGLLSTGSAAAQFYFLGDAQYMNGDCVMLTPDAPYREGIAYSTSRLNLEGPFYIEFDIYLGDKDDDGADGITFVIHDDPRGFDAYGTWGECIGYGRWSPEFGTSITPSIAIEFDTYQNYRQNDPGADHAAYLENGVSLHRSAASYWHDDDPDFNLEDDRLHSFRFRWEPTTQTITATLDGQVVYEGKRDLVNDIFKGKTQVIWGFTASTGRKYNLQYFCLRRLVRL